jgi:hypothetical protein
MPRLSTLSNPTGLVELDRKRIGLVLDDKGSAECYSLVRLDLSELTLPAHANVIVIARRGNAELRTDHGPASDWDKGLIDISEVGSDGAWKFRVLLVQAGVPKLVAAAENIRPDGLGDSESLIGLESAELGQLPWKLLVLEQEGRAVIRFNRDIYLSAAAAEADHHFACLVFPEAVRQLAEWHTRQEPTAIADPQWEPFRAWLALHGISEDPPDEGADEAKRDWCNAVASAFSSRHRVADRLREGRSRGSED